MEPADIIPTSPDDDQLAAWYRANVSAAPLPDDGFSRSVLAALPPPQRSVAARRRLFCLTGALIGTAIAFAKVFGYGESLPDLPEFESSVAGTFSLPSSAVFALALGIAALSLWYVFRPKLHFLPRF